MAAIPVVWWGWNSYASEAAKIDLSTMRQMKEGVPVLDRNGRPAGTLSADNRKFVQLREVPKHLIDALIATEDARFYQHHGMDFQGIARAMMKNFTSFSVKQGGSTITQQLARQAFELKGRTLHRKLLESFVASRIEQAYSKDEILESYLNRIYLGSGFYGIGSAARGYFDKDIKDVTLEEAALIVGIIKAPVSFSPFKDMAAARRTRDLTLHRMETMNMIDAELCNSAQASSIVVLPENTRLGRQNYLLAAVERDLQKLDDDGSKGPWKSVSVTVDARLQMQVDAMVGGHVSRVEQELQGTEEGKARLQGAAIVIDNRTGEVLATCGGRDFLTSPFDRATQGRRPAGTAFLPVAYAAILAHKPELIAMHVLDGPLDNKRVMIAGDDGILGEWGAETAQPVYEGYVPALYGLLKGKTGVTVRLAYEAGMEGVKSELERCGFSTPLNDYSSVVLGSSPVRLIDMARAYASLAQEGSLPPARSLVTRAESDHARPGNTNKTAESTRVFDSTSAAQVRNVLVTALRHPDKQRVLQGYGLQDRGLAGWGGTAHGFTDAWYIGFDRNVTCAVWIGFDESRRMGKEAWSKVTAFPLWAELMAAATNSDARGWTPTAKDSMLCLKSGDLATDECQRDPNYSLAQLVPATAAKFKSPCIDHARSNLHRPYLITMEKEVTLINHATPIPAPLALSPVAPLEPALVGPNPYKAP